MAEDRMAVLETVRKAIAEGDVDFLREGVRVLAQAVMEAEVTELTGLPKGERDPERRLTHRNGYRDRRWDTRVGTIEPRDPAGSATARTSRRLLEPRRRAERALLAVVQEAYVLGVSTRRVDDLVEALGHRGDQQERGQPDLRRRSTPRSRPSAAVRSRTRPTRTCGSTRRTSRCARAAGWCRWTALVAIGVARTGRAADPGPRARRRATTRARPGRRSSGSLVERGLHGRPPRHQRRPRRAS